MFEAHQAELDDLVAAVVEAGRLDIDDDPDVDTRSAGGLRPDVIACEASQDAEVPARFEAVEDGREASEVGSERTYRVDRFGGRSHTAIDGGEAAEQGDTDVAKPIAGQLGGRRRQHRRRSLSLMRFFIGEYSVSEDTRNLC